MGQDKFKILIIGAGSIGKRHLENLISLGIEDIAVVEVNKECSLSIEDSFKVKTYNSVEDAFEDKEFNIAFICSPTKYHLDQAIICAEHNCDLFIEKPLSHKIENIDNLLNIIKEKELITMVGSNWKFHPLFKKMKELIDSRAVGRILSARCQFGQYLPDWHPWEDYRKGYSANKELGGGILLDSHEFDYLTWFLGYDVKKIACIFDKVSDIEINTEDVAEIILKFASGIIAEIHVDYIQRFPQRNFEFFGESGTIIWNSKENKVSIFDVEKEKKDFCLEQGYEFNNMYIEEVKHFLDCIEKRKDATTPMSVGKKVLELICAAKESSSTNKIINL